MPDKESNLEKELTFTTDSVWKGLKEKEIDEIMEFNEEYKKFLSKAKTEREFIIDSEQILQENGFVKLSDIGKLEPNMKVYDINKKKNIALAVIGKQDLREGCNIVASHIDSPRIDLKARPLYEDKDSLMSVFKTHYYGGIKKYQWVNTPLALHGRIVKEDGECVDICIGEKEEDPVFVVSDLLPHLSRKLQGKRKTDDVIKGEELNVLVGSIPIDDEDISDKIKINILKLLKDKYGLKEEDFVSGEIQIVPAGDARDVGLDRSMLGGYGHDDKVCSYTALRAILDIKKPDRTAVVVLYDKEEIGSVGNTGASSLFLQSFLSDIYDLSVKDYRIKEIHDMMRNSLAISGDVSAGVNPSFKSVHEMMNAAKLGCGIVLTKFTGAGGKFSGNDAHAEYIAYIRNLFNSNKIKWQPCELGKVDEGGGGTVAKYLANMNMDIVDAGPAVVGMHSPFEIVSKADVFETYRAYKIFLESKGT